MCECGCDQGPDFYFPGPDGITYGLQLYRGCRDCDSAPGVALFKIPAKSLEHFAPDDDRDEPKWVSVSQGDWEEVAVAMVDRDLLTEAVKADEDADLLSLSDDDGEIAEETASEVAWCAWKALIRVAFRKKVDTPSERVGGNDG